VLTSADLAEKLTVLAPLESLVPIRGSGMKPRAVRFQLQETSAVCHNENPTRCASVGGRKDSAVHCSGKLVARACQRADLRLLAISGAGLLALALIAGCAPSDPNADQGENHTTEASDRPLGTADQALPPDPNLPADAILKRLLATYRQARTYQDQGVVRLEFRQNGEPVRQEWPAAVTFERPNKLSLVAYQATVKCNGKELRARIDDPVSGDVDDQVVVRPAPQELKLADLAGDALLYDILASQLRRQPIQLELLLESGGLVSAFEGGVACKRLDDRQIGDRTCFRIEVPSPGGAFVFWIDQARFVLRRLDYPAAALLPDLVQDPLNQDVQLYAELRDAVIDGAIDDALFVLDIPPDAKRMKTFVVPPRPLPSKLFGQIPRDFYFLTANGERLSQADLKGKVAVLAWFQRHPACEATLQQVSEASKRLGPEADAAFAAVATDPTDTTAERLEEQLRQWKVDLPLVRDLEAFGKSVFQIELQPTIVVLDAEGRVQIFQTGGSPELADQLVAIVGRLKQGDDLAAEIVARHESEQSEYDALVARGGPEPGEIVELPEAIIRPRSQPRRLKLEPLWTNTELKSPGNFLLVEAEGQRARALVVEGWRTMSELSAGGEVVVRHQLDLPEQAVITYVRTATDETGKRVFAATAPLAGQAYLFDENWRRIAIFPGPGDAPVQLTDLAFADVGEPDQQPALIASSVAEMGLTAISLEGKVEWRNRSFPNALSLAVTRPDDVGSWGILVTGESGAILRVNRFGREEPPVMVGQWPILKLVGARFNAATQAPLIALSNDPQGNLFAVGLTDKLKESWNYPLPTGMHQKPIEPIASSHILPGRAGEWWLAGPDGSIHVITEDGEFHDSFHYGAPLTGIAATMLDEQPVLLVAMESGVEAFKVSLPEARER
jgi:hypothetical protein